MSHVSCIETEIKDLDALEAAAATIGMELVRGQTTHNWYGTWVNDYHGGDAAYHHGIKPADYGKCHHAIRIPGKADAYEVGVVQMEDGTFRLVWDFWAGGCGLEEKIGKGGAQLLQGYSMAVATKALVKKGLKVTDVQKLKNGKLKVTLKG